MTGPGKPYWNSPAGSTICFATTGKGAATGAGTWVVEVAETVVEEATAWIFFSERVDNIAAVTLAPVAALTAAMIAIVAFDILAEGARRAGLGDGYLFGSWKGEEESDSRRRESRRDINAREKEGVVLKVVDCSSRPRIKSS